MKKNVLFIMYTGIIGDGLSKSFDGDKEYDISLTKNYKESELYVGNKTPDVVVVEVPDYSMYPLSFCLDICRKYKRTYPRSKTMLFITYTYLDEILPEVIEAKREGDIDGFASANMRIEEVVATIKAL